MFNKMSFMFGLGFKFLIALWACAVCAFCLQVFSHFFKSSINQPLTAYFILMYALILSFFGCLSYFLWRDLLPKNFRYLILKKMYINSFIYLAGLGSLLVLTGNIILRENIDIFVVSGCKTNLLDTLLYLFYIFILSLYVLVIRSFYRENKFILIFSKLIFMLIFILLSFSIYLASMPIILHSMYDFVPACS